MKWLWLILFLFMVGCAGMALTPEQKLELNKLKAQLEKGKKDLKSAEATRRDIKAQIQLLIEDVKTGNVTPESAADVFTGLYKRLDEVENTISVLSADYDNTMAQISATKESGVPWWRIGLEVLLIVGGTISGGKYLAAVKAVRTVVQAVENNKKQADIKAEVSDAANPLIEKVVAKIDPK